MEAGNCKNMSQPGRTQNVFLFLCNSAPVTNKQSDNQFSFRPLAQAGPDARGKIASKFCDCDSGAKLKFTFRRLEDLRRSETEPCSTDPLIEGPEGIVVSSRKDRTGRWKQACADTNCVPNSHFAICRNAQAHLFRKREKFCRMPIDGSNCEHEPDTRRTNIKLFNVASYFRIHRFGKARRRHKSGAET
ncbi:hypothetical protein LAB1_01250 [Roseibium sp. LAB1]